MPADAQSADAPSPDAPSPDAACAPLIGEYDLTAVMHRDGSCDATTESAMAAELNDINSQDLWGTLCVFATTACGMAGIVTDAPYDPRLDAQATPSGVTDALFTLTGPAGCIEHFEAKYVYARPLGTLCV